MWLLASAIILTLFLLGYLLWNTSHPVLPSAWATEGRFEPGPDPLLVEFAREERVAWENFERRYARYPQCFYAEGQIRSK